MFIKLFLYNVFCQPVRDHFKTNNEAKELLKAVKVKLSNSRSFLNIAGSRLYNLAIKIFIYWFLHSVLSWNIFLQAYRVSR